MPELITTAAQWASVEDKLDGLFGGVKLRVDGYLVSLANERVSRNKLAIVIFVNGHLRGEWARIAEAPEHLHPIGRRFYRPSMRRKYSSEQIKRLEKLWGKRQMRKRGYYGKWIIPRPSWNTPKTLTRHLRTHNERIELLTDAEYTEAITAQILKEAEAA